MGLMKCGNVELISDIVYALISQIVFFGEGRIEIEYAFADEMKAFVELAESRKEEISCMKQAVCSLKRICGLPVCPAFHRGR